MILNLILFGFLAQAQENLQSIAELQTLVREELQKSHFKKALEGAQKLISLVPDSPVFKTDYALILPYTQKWEEAEEALQESYYIYWDRAAQEDSDPSDYEGYFKTLENWALINMLLNPAKAVLILEEGQSRKGKFTKDYLDFYSLSVLDTKMAHEEIVKVEKRSEEWKNFVWSSRFLFELINKTKNIKDLSQEFDLKALEISSDKKAVALSLSLNLLKSLEEGDLEKENQVTEFIFRRLDRHFSKSTLRGWQGALWESLIFMRLFEAYSLSEQQRRLQKEIIEVYL